MTQWSIGGVFNAFFHILFFGNPQTMWSRALVWLIRIITISLLLRTYIAPWLLALTSKHFRARSISLRSIKGLYFKKGIWVCRAERIGYVFGTVEGRKRLTVRIDGLKVEMEKEGEEEVKVKRRSRHRRNMTLADLHPSPLAGRLWRMLTKVALKVEPWLRPLIRNAVVACLRIAIQLLPVVTQALSFELHSTVFSLAHIPGTQVVADEINLHAELSLTQVESLADCAAVKNIPTPQSASWTFYGMATWRRVTSDGLRRAWNRAWGRTHGAATVSFKLSDVTGITPRQDQSGTGSSRTFLRLPGTVALDGNLKFYPQTSTIDKNSITLALGVDEVSLKVDVLNEILRAIVPPRGTPITRVPDEAPLPGTPALPKPPGGNEPAATPTPSIPIFKRSRSSTIFSASFLPVSPTATFLALEGKLLSPRASASPFIKAFSSSISSGRRIFAEPVRKLKDYHYESVLSTIKSITVQVSSVSLSFSSSAAQSISYNTAIKDFRLDFHPSDVATDPLHGQWLGRTSKQEKFDPETYGLQLQITTVVLERHKRGEFFPLVTMGSLDFQAVTIEWPSPWLTPSQFMKGDPNAPFLATSLKIGGVELTDRLGDLREFLERQVSKRNTETPKKHRLTTLDGIQLPRCSIQVHCGVICARIICESSDQQVSTTSEMRTNGFSFGLDATYESHLASSTTPTPDCARLMSSFFFHLDPVLLHVRSGWTSVGFASDSEFLDDPALFSIGAIETGGLMGVDAEEELGVYRVKGGSLFCNLHAIIDTFCVELWHADSVSATVQLLAMLPSSSEPSNKVPSKPKKLSLPSGFTASLSLAHFVVVVTAPDINPIETDLSRGIGLRALISLELWSPRSVQLSHRGVTLDPRLLLGLSKERLVDTIASSKGGTNLTNASAVGRLSISNLIVRSGVATQFESDDPFLVGRDDSTPTDQEFIRIENVQVDASLVAPTSNDSKHASCHVTVDVSRVRGNFQLSNIYATLLALQTFQTLAKVRRPIQPKAHDPESSLIKWSTECRIHTFNLLWALPNQRVVSLLEDASFTWLSGHPVHTKFNSLAFWVPPPIQVDRWEHDLDQKWDELLTLYEWDISLPVVDHLESIAAKGESLRLRIPHGYVLANLILDLTVVAKALKHLVHIVGSGAFSDMPAPEPEGPKLSPNMTFDVRHFCIEAIDDPFEARLGAIWKIGLEAVKQRLEREEAFNAKIAAIQAIGSNPHGEVVVEGEHDYRFSAKHSVSVDDARRRLDEVHFLDWKFRLQNLKAAWSRQEMLVLHKLYGPRVASGRTPFSKSKIAVNTEASPLFRVFITSLNLTISLPTFSLEEVPDFLHEQGQGLPRDTEFSLLVPLHINFELNSFRITIRDFPIPLLHAQAEPGSEAPALTFDSDIVIAEEMGSELSTDWVECPILVANQGLHGASPLTLHVPKTIMPVKSYARPNICVSSTCPTILSWGVSYGPVIQDIVRVIETLTPNPRDPSPPIGFWDKLRLVAHWKVEFLFKGEARCYLKGSRDPTNITDNGAGFVLVWKGSPRLLIGHPNEQRELIQLTSDIMLIAIPRFGEPGSDGVLNLVQSSTNPYRKICAELHSGVRYGIGFVFERTCDDECLGCSGNVFQRHCRLFDFIPHYDVRLEVKSDQPQLKGATDTYREFRSDFIHFSFSLAASTRTSKDTANALHLTPKAFAHFWAWCSLFDSIPTLRIRVGTYFSPRAIAPKFGRHIATIKYRIILTKLFVMHGYIDDSKQPWIEGITPWVGVKGMVDEFTVDMHQRDQETKVRGIDPDTIRTARRKPFYAAEVVLKGADLRAVLAIFKEPLKREISIAGPSLTSAYLKNTDLPQTSFTSPWYSIHDFVELDWTSSSEPTLHFLPLATCPRFAYFKRNAAKTGHKRDNKFGVEPTHYCLLGEEPSVPQIQIALTAARVEELRRRSVENPPYETLESRRKMMTLLQDYIKFLAGTEADANSGQPNVTNYHMPSEVVLPEEWAEFDHVYQLHCPNLSLDKPIKDIMIQYYHCSKERKGFEYHLATRAVKFIRDQAGATRAPANPEFKERGNAINTAQLAASAIRRMLKGEGTKTSIEVDQQDCLGLQTDPLDGWSDGVTPRKSHCCILLKPQVVLTEEESGAVCVVAAVQAKLQSFAIMDNANIDDPISGKIMTRNYTSLSGFQMFSPTNAVLQNRLRVPLEVLIDLRCESDEFERLVPQTDATFHYDKFNRLRLRSDITSEPSAHPSLDTTPSVSHTHLQDQTDLIRIHIPHFTVSANDKHFQTISNIVTKLLLFSDPMHKARLDKLETLLFTYDFADLCQAADVVVSLQGRLRASLEMERSIDSSPHYPPGEEDTKIGRLRLRAHIIALTEELNYLFDAIKLAQDRADGQMDQKSALLVHASSLDMSWRMLDEAKGLLAKLVIQHSNFYWLSRQDSAMVNDLVIGNLQAFDGSREALWTEILSKHDEPANHPLHKRNLFLLAHWVILPPVGGISIYEAFEVSLHPLKLQIDAKLGRRIMEYLWPDRRNRPQTTDDEPAQHPEITYPAVVTKAPPLRTSLDSPRALQRLHPDSTHNHNGLAPSNLRKLSPSRSFTDLRTTREDHHRPHLLSSNGGFSRKTESPDTPGFAPPRPKVDSSAPEEQTGDAAVMKTRSSQKTFVFVKIASMNLILSVVKEGSFECHDVRIRTRDLVYRNQTSSFEELVNQFIPSNMNWKGWMKMVFHQPLIPVLPVAKEILSKTKFKGSSRVAHDADLDSRRPGKETERKRTLTFHLPGRSHSRSLHSKRAKKTIQPPDVPRLTSQPLVAEPEPMGADDLGIVQTVHSDFGASGHHNHSPMDETEANL